MTGVLNANALPCITIGTDVWGEGDAAALWVTRAMLAADHRTMYCEHHGFYADAVFGEAASTAEVYNAVLGGPLQHGSTTVLCFGQTGSGKTFTLAGSSTFCGRRCRVVAAGGE